MSLYESFAQLRSISPPKSTGGYSALRHLASDTFKFFEGLGEESACTAEHCLIFSYVVFVIWALLPLCWLGALGICSSALVPIRGPIITATLSGNRAHAQTHHRIRDLADRLKFSEESIRQLVKDEPGVVKVRRGRKAAHTSYSVPESVAISIYARLGGEASTFHEEHYRITDVVSLWGFGRETVRQLIKDEPGVLKFALGCKGAHSTYSIPESVLKRIHNRLLYVV